METTRLCGMGLSATLTAGQDKDYYHESFSLEADIINNCLGLCKGKDKDGMSVVEIIEVAEVAETTIWVFLAMKTC